MYVAAMVQNCEAKFGALLRSCSRYQTGRISFSSFLVPFTFLTMLSKICLLYFSMSVYGFDKTAAGC